MISKIVCKCRYWLGFVAISILSTACQTKIDQEQGKADKIYYNAYIYPVTGNPLDYGAVAVVNGKIAAVGNSGEILDIWQHDSTLAIDCKGMFLMPGFIEGHGHLSSMGFNLIQLDLLATTSWQEIMDSVASHAARVPKGTWITGRGWHQEKWNEAVQPNVDGYPYHDDLTSLTPEHPVMIVHASGHSLFANKAAMDHAGITGETPDPIGGKVIRDQQGRAIGVFEENAMELIRNAHKDYTATLSQQALHAQWQAAIASAEEHCFAHGITSFHDAGASLLEIDRYHSMAKNDSLQLRVYCMLKQPYDEIKNRMSVLPIIGAGNDRFTCRTIKAYLDGALGSYGAWLLKPYLERPDFTGQITTTIEEIRQLATLCVDHNLQMAVHAIGDKANRTVLDIYEEMAGASGLNERRWRIEHAQHIDTADIPRFKKLNVIASMQAVHCISDAPFVEKRIGYDRARYGAYAWRSLIDAGAHLANGTDTPVEKIDPFQNLYASVTRKRIDSGESFFPEQAMTRAEAIKSYTINNAYAAFEENTKGSIEPGKWADLVLVSNNLLTCQEDSILATKVLMTVVGGEVQYRGKTFH